MSGSSERSQRKDRVKVSCSEINMADNKPVSTTSDVLANSTAVVQYSSVQFPMQFSTIGLNTDLKEPPAGSASTGIPQATQEFSPFSSINMAHAYPDLVGKVDVISSSKNIKGLLKLPFSDSPRISIMVHRLRKTLLLEDFDVNKNLLRNESEDWAWLKDYLNKIIAKGERTGEDRMRCLISAANRDHHAENMYINLIRHSFAASSIENMPYSVMELGGHAKQVHTLPPEPSEEELRGFHRETLWKFEDISMLIDSDLPIFGNGNTKRPCISLRLRDARSPPINILTGLDYWLDNLMSNVPEVAMCYHIDGFVQKYEVIRTEDIPELDSSKFDPQVVMDIARNIMSFIKANAAVEGHTYWLYKGENDETVKLYDLTDHCKNEITADDNPFTVPVGLLCFRAGHKLKTSDQRRSADARALLENSLALLDETKHSQTCSSAHFHLSDMWVPNRSVNDIWSEKGKLSEPPSDLYDEESSSEDSTELREQTSLKALTGITESKPEEPVKNEVALRELFVRGMIKKKAWDIVQSCRIAGETDQRCKMALSHIRRGLSCIDRDHARGKNIGLVETQQTCNPFEAIPLHYSPLRPKKQDTATNSVVEHKQDCPFVSTHSDEDEIQRMCCPSRPIPLHFSPSPPSDTAQAQLYSQIPTESEQVSEDSSNHVQAQSVLQPHSEESPSSSSDSSDLSSTSSIFPSWLTSDPSMTFDSWHIHAKFSILWKATITYFVLAKSYFEISKYGHTLRHVRYAMHTYECLALLHPRVREDHADKEVYFLMLLLAAQARTCLSSSNWQACHKEFDELGEEEAAILSSAQLLVTTPKNEWVYMWSGSMEENFITAKELYESCLSSPEFPKRPADFREDIKRNRAVCIMHLGDLKLEAVKEKFKKTGSFEYCKRAWDKSLQYYRESIKAFEGSNEKNTGGHVYVNIANLYIIAGNASRAVHGSIEDPLPMEGRSLYYKAIESFEKSLDTLGRHEMMDETRENIYSNLRGTYFQMASAIAVMMPDLITHEYLNEMKKLVKKSLFYCHLDRNIPEHQLYAAGCHIMLARIYEVETKFKSLSHRRALLQKADESYQAAFDLYGKLMCYRNQIHIKDSWIKCILGSKDFAVQPDPQKKRLIRRVLTHLTDVQPIMKNLLLEDNQPLNSNDYMYLTTMEAMEHVIGKLNWAFQEYLKIERGCIAVKDLYMKCLSNVTKRKEVEELIPALDKLLCEVKTFLMESS